MADLVRHGLAWPATRKQGSKPRSYAPGAEAKLQAAVMTLARALGWECFHTYDAQRSEPGQPDLQLRRPPRLVFAELKTDFGILKSDQKRVLRSLALCRQDVYVWRDRMYPRPVQVILGAGYVCAHNYKRVRGALLDICEVCGRVRGLENLDG